MAGKQEESRLAKAIMQTLISSNVTDSNFEDANIVDAVDGLRRAVHGVAKAITPTDAVGGPDYTGGHVESLTEAVMGVTAGLCKIADAIESLADAVRSHGEL